MSETETMLDAQHQIATAMAETGLSDWGDPSFRDRFTLAIEHLRSIPMNEAGQKNAVEVCHWLLTDRLRFVDDHARYGLEAELIDSPMFATGEPRSGTTLMHALMSVDPDARALRFWEVMHPSPPPGLAAPDDTRITEANKEWREINAKMPMWLRCHPYNDMLGDGLPEDERAWAIDFRMMTPTAWWRVPMQTLSMGLPADARAQYRIHKMMLQHIQHGRPKKYWVLKGFHGSRLKELFEAYPNAHLVWLHRDPVQVAASRTMMMADILAGIVGPIDLQKEARMHLAMTRASIANTMSNELVDDPRIHHVRYTDFVADPIGTIRGYYEFCGRPLTAYAETAMRDYLTNNKGDRYGKFHYASKVLTDIGEDIDALHAEFEPFRKRFGVPIEKRA